MLTEPTLTLCELEDQFDAVDKAASADDIGEFEAHLLLALTALAKTMLLCNGYTQTDRYQSQP